MGSHAGGVGDAVGACGAFFVLLVIGYRQVKDGALTLKAGIRLEKPGRGEEDSRDGAGSESECCEDPHKHARINV